MNRAGMSPGFSLVELMVTVALVTLILGLFAAYTSSSSFRLEATANSLFATLQKTRLEAIMRNRNVSLSFDINADGSKMRASQSMPSRATCAWPVFWVA